MIKIKKAVCFCILCIFCIYCLYISLNNLKKDNSVFSGQPIDKNIIIRKPDITVGKITIEWFLSKKPLDMRKASLFQAININAESVYKNLNNNKWFLGSCEIVRNNGARGLNREWKGDIPKNINGNIFIPTSVVDGNEEYLHILMHRIIALAMYKVIHKEILLNKGEKYADKVKLKWINDVIVNRKKIAALKPDDFGSTNKVISYQFGMNVNMPKEELQKIDQPATSMSVECGGKIDHERILRETAVEIVKLFEKYKHNLDNLDKEFSSKMAFIGEEVFVQDYLPGGNVEGILEEISGGKLYIRNPATNKVLCIFPGTGILKSKKTQKINKNKYQ